MGCLVNRSAVTTAAMVVAAGLAAAGCSTSSGSTTSVASCSGKHAAPGTASSAQASSPGPAVAAGWTLPGANLANTRDVQSAITSSNVAQLGVAWCVPIESTGEASSIGLTDGYSTTPVIVN